MKYSYNWLKELSGTKLTPEKMAESLTMHSLEIEGLEKTGNEFKNIIVGKILEIRKHPNADKLQLVKVDVGKSTSPQPSPYKGEGLLDVVCGAWNIKVGDKVPVALVGAKLPIGIEIKEAEIRGEKSYGMLCTLDELGLGDDHSGIIILDKKAKIGEPVKKYLGTSSDSVLEIKVLPDRAHDAMSHVGVAREISVLSGFARSGEAGEYDFEGLKLPNIKSKILAVKIEDKKLCPRYIGAVMENVEIKDSPQWMKDRLKVCGIKSINNIVDATNYIMLELGQPLHAFDLEQVKNAIQNAKVEIVVRRAKNKEKLILLDDSEMELSNADLLITNGEMPLALAGIMGGKESGINENTKTIVLEAANFNAINIRRSRTKLEVRTESSDRFEKDIDPNLAEKAMVRIVELLEKTAAGKLEGITDVYPNKIKPWKIKLDVNYINKLLGEIIPSKEIIKILNLLGITTTIQPYKVVKNNDNKLFLECAVPTFRLDLRTQEDLIEEIGRIWGYEKIKIQPILDMEFSPIVNKQLAFEKEVKKALSGLGYDEMYNYSFYSKRDAENCALDGVKHLELVNPMNPDQQFVRISLIPNILKNIKTNLKHFESFNIFEIGKTYQSENNKVEEKRMLVMAKILEKDRGAETFYGLKGVAQSLLEKFGIGENEALFKEKNLPKNHLGHPTRNAEIIVNGEKVGSIFEINPLVLGRYKVAKRVAITEIDLEKMLKVSSKEITYKQLQKFPTVTRDISMLAKKETKAIDISNLIKKIGGNLVLNVKMFDVFFKDGQTSFAYHIEFGASERTLENIEVDNVMKKMVSGLEKNLKVEVRK